MNPTHPDYGKGKPEGTEFSLEDSRQAWEANAKFWDARMGDASNAFHRQVVRPRVSELLDVRPDDFILDIACGNGNYAAYMAQLGARVVAFDYSPRMIALAKARQAPYLNQIEFCVADAADEAQLGSLKRERPYQKAVSNMALMDMTELAPLFRQVHELLEAGGVFVFSTQHPCFITLTEKYRTPHSYYGIAIQGQPQRQCYYHRSLQQIATLCFQSGFIIDGLYEESFLEKEKPDVLILRARKQ